MMPVMMSTVSSSVGLSLMSCIWINL
jgi:hypothetical protein